MVFFFFGRIKTTNPADLDDVNCMLSKPRDSQSPTQSEYEGYVREVEYASNESSMQANTWPFLGKRPNQFESAYTANQGYQWTEAESSLAYRISDAKPDYFECFQKDQYPQEAHDELGGSLCPTQYAKCMPAFAVEWKGKDGSMATAERQCAYDGALMNEGAIKTDTYLGKDPAQMYGKKQALTIASNGEYLHVFSHHAEQSESKETTYHARPLKILTPRNSFGEFKETRRTVRNAQTWRYQHAAARRDETWRFVEQLHQITQAPADEVAEEEVERTRKVRKRGRKKGTGSHR